MSLFQLLTSCFILLFHHICLSPSIGSGCKQLIGPDLVKVAAQGTFHTEESSRNIKAKRGPAEALCCFESSRYAALHALTCTCASFMLGDGVREVGWKAAVKAMEHVVPFAQVLLQLLACRSPSRASASTKKYN